jgi:hypothetical protein
VAKQTGKPDSLQPVSFTRAAANRIAKTVSRVEGEARKTEPLRFGPRQRPRPGVVGDIFRTARFTGSWSVDSTATVEFTNSTFTPQTATAINLFCGIADWRRWRCQRYRKRWHLISWEMQEVCTTRIIDIELDLNTANCEIYRTLVTATQKFLRLTFPFATCSTATTPG